MLLHCNIANDSAGRRFCLRACTFVFFAGLAACRGNYSAIDASTGATSATTGGGSSNPGANEPDSQPAPYDFVALPPSAYVNKVKTLLTGMAANQNEVAEVVADPGAMGGLLDTWMQSQAYQDNMKYFFSTALQQVLATNVDFQQIHMGFAANTPLQQNLEDSMALTMQYYAKEGAPFTKLASTRSFMMTTAMMALYAFEDTQTRSDTGAYFDTMIGDPKLGANANYHFALQAAGTEIALSSTLNPADPNYLVFHFPQLLAWEPSGAPCSPIDPLVINRFSNIGGLYYVNQLLMNFLQNSPRYYYPPGATSPLCYMRAVAQPLPPVMLQPTDYSDWHMVTVRQPQAGEKTAQFFNVPGLRGTNSLVLNTPRVGFFTTLPFLAQWYTNPSNQARVTMNQTLIVALGHDFNGADAVSIPATPALDSQHASDPVCFSCHQNLDPMRQFFRHDYSIYFSPQTDSNQKAILPTFAFDGVTSPASTVYDLGDALAAHPRFARAWTQKLCTWANSAVCSETDPEFIRVAQVFAQSGYAWNTLVKTLMSSPLVTYSEDTPTAAMTQQVTSIARREQFCALLDARLGLSDFCGLSTAVGGQTSSPLVSAFPSGLYSRGVVSTVFVTNPDLMIRTETENLCVQASAKVVDAGTNSLLSSSDVPASVRTLVTQLMGVNGDAAAEPTSILSAHFAKAVAVGATPKQAMQSTFVAACLSPSVVAIGL